MSASGRPPRRRPRIRAEHASTPREEREDSETRAGASARASRSLLPLLTLCLGALIGRFVGQRLAPDAANIFDLAVTAGLAFVAALAYRRFARRALAERHRLQARRARAAAAPEEPPASDAGVDDGEPQARA